MLLSLTAPVTHCFLILLLKPHTISPPLSLPPFEIQYNGIHSSFLFIVFEAGGVRLSRAPRSVSVGSWHHVSLCKNNPLSPRWSAQAGVELQGLEEAEGQSEQEREGKTPSSSVQWGFISETQTPGLAVCLTLCCLLLFLFFFHPSFPAFLHFFFCGSVCLSASCQSHLSAFPTKRTCVFKSDKPGWQLMRIFKMICVQILPSETLPLCFPPPLLPGKAPLRLQVVEIHSAQLMMFPL